MLCAPAATIASAITLREPLSVVVDDIIFSSSTTGAGVSSPLGPRYSLYVSLADFAIVPKNDFGSSSGFSSSCTGSSSGFSSSCTGSSTWSSIGSVLISSDTLPLPSPSSVSGLGFSVSSSPAPPHILG